MKSLIFITLALSLTALAEPSFDAIKVEEQKATLTQKIAQPEDVVQTLAFDEIFVAKEVLVADSVQFIKHFEAALTPQVEMTFMAYQAPTIKDTLKLNYKSKYFSRNANRPCSRFHVVLHV